jgi:hypothetical protein
VTGLGRDRETRGSEAAAPIGPDTSGRLFLDCILLWGHANGTDAYFHNIWSGMRVRKTLDWGPRSECRGDWRKSTRSRQFCDRIHWMMGFWLA